MTFPTEVWFNWSFRVWKVIIGRLFKMNGLTRSWISLKIRVIYHFLVLLQFSYILTFQTYHWICGSTHDPTHMSPSNSIVILKIKIEKMREKQERRNKSFIFFQTWWYKAFVIQLCNWKLKLYRTLVDFYKHSIKWFQDVFGRIYIDVWDIED